MFRHGTRGILRPCLYRTSFQQSRLQLPPLRRYASNSPPSSKPQAPWSRTRPKLTTPTDDSIDHRITFLKWLFRFLALGLAGHIFLEYFYICTQAWGISMLPTIASSGDFLIISKYYRHGRDVEVGDVISFRHPINEGEHAVKRLIGMPGDFVLRDTPGHGDMMIQVPVGHCWVVGDNLTWSRDSRIFGPLPLALVNGKVLAKFNWGALWPEKIKHGLQTAVLYEDEDDVE